MKNSLARRKYLIDQNPQQFKEFEHEQAFFEAVKNAKNYIQQRFWMIDQGIDFSNYPEEREFQEVNKKLKLEAGAMTVRFTRACFMATDKQFQISRDAQILKEKKEKEQKRVEAIKMQMIKKVQTIMTANTKSEKPNAILEKLRDIK